MLAFAKLFFNPSKNGTILKIVRELMSTFTPSKDMGNSLKNLRSHIGRPLLTHADIAATRTWL